MTLDFILGNTEEAVSDKGAESDLQSLSKLSASPSWIRGRKFGADQQ